MHNLIIYGGTFDPIHNGHLNTAINVQNHFHFDRFIFLPCKIPLLKSGASATTTQRVAMLERALATQNKNLNFTIDLSEINRETPSYMVVSLNYFRQQFGHKTAITLLIGQDAFNQLHRWHEWTKLLTLANLLVITRAGYEATPPAQQVQQLAKQHETNQDRAICMHPHGLIYHFNAGHFACSSSGIRQQLALGKEVDDCLPQPVKQYIKQNKLYLNTV